MSNSNSFGVAAEDDREARFLPWPFRVLVPGYEAGWPA